MPAHAKAILALTRAHVFFIKFALIGKAQIYAVVALGLNKRIADPASSSRPIETAKAFHIARHTIKTFYSHIVIILLIGREVVF